MTISRTFRIVPRHRTSAHPRRDQTSRVRRDAERINALWATGVWPAIWL